MSFSKLKFLKLIFLFSYFLYKTASVIVADSSLIQSLWLISFENIPRPLQVAIEQNFKQLPSRWLSAWEREIYEEESLSTLEKLKWQSEYQEAQNQLDFSTHNYQRQQVYNLSYEKPSFEEEASPSTKEAKWAKLVFKVEDKAKIQTLDTFTGWLEFSSPSLQGEDLLVVYVTLHLKNGTKLKKEFAFVYNQNFQEASISIRDSLAKILLNYEWVRLSFPFEPADALIQIDSLNFASNDPKLLFFPLAKLPIKLTLIKEGYESLTLNIKKVEDIPKKIDLVPLQPCHFRISTHPSPANLYLDNLWLGQSPLSFQAIPQGRVLSVEAEGYRPRYFPLESLKKDNFIDLRSLASCKETRQLQKNKKRFYASLGTFILSFIPTALFASIDINTNRLHEMGYKCNLKLTASLFWGSVGINFACLIWNIVESVLYIKQAEKCAKP